MKHFILKENNDEESEEKNYVIKDGEKYYLNDSYIREELMDELISYAKKELSEDSWVSDYIQDNIETYTYNQDEINVKTVFKYIEEYRPEYAYIYELYKESEDIDYNDVEKVLKDCVSFSSREYDYTYDFEEDNVEECSVFIKGLFDLNLLTKNKIKVYDEYKEEYIEEQLITKKEAEYISEKLDGWVYNTYLDDFYEYINEKEYHNKEIYYNFEFNLYRNIDINVFIERLKEEFPDVFEVQSLSKKIVKTLKGNIISPRKDFNYIENLKLNNVYLKRVISYLYSLNPDLDKKYSYQNIKELMLKNKNLESALSSRIENKSILDRFKKGYTINNLIELDSTQIKQHISNISIFKILKNSDLIVEFTKWTSPLQRVFLKKDNYVFQLNLKNEKYEEILNHVVDNSDFDYEELNDNIEKYMKDSIHPISREKLTLAWIRFTKISEEEIVLDEIQTDLDNPTQGIDTFNNLDLIDGWEDIILSKFIKFVRYNLSIRNIYYPTIITKKDRYKAKAPTYLYSELPKKYGFSSQSSNLEGFMLLEKKITN